MPTRGKRPFYYAAPVASSNWRYLTDIDGAGPRKDEIMLTTTDAKKSFALETSDIARIEGFRRPGARSTLTLYYHGDLVALSVKKHGQEHFDAKIPEGRKLSGADAREQALRTQQAALDADARNPYSVVPAGRLCNLPIYRLQEMVIRYEGGKEPPHCSSKQMAVERLIAAGYSEAAEAAHAVKQRAEDEAAAKQRQIEIAERNAEQARRDAEQARKREEAARRLSLGEAMSRSAARAGAERRGASRHPNHALCRIVHRACNDWTLQAPRSARR